MQIRPRRLQSSDDGWLGRRIEVVSRVGRDVAIAGPVLAVVYLTLFGMAHVFAYDFEQSFYPAAKHVLDGQSPFPPATHAAVTTGTAFVYPPLTALLIAPLTLLPVSVAGVIFTLILIACTVLTLRVLEVRDWRCYAAVFAWPPVLSGLQTANLTLLLALGAAVLWRYRERRAVVVCVTAGLVALKLFLWPLVVWLLATRRTVSAIQAVVLAAVITFASWALIGFAGLHEYVPLLRLFSDVAQRRGYTPLTLALKVGFGSSVAQGLWLAIGALLVGGIVVLGRRRHEREAFVLAVVTAILCSPVAWLHYYAMLMVPLAILRPRYSWIWIVPFIVIGAPAAASGPSWWSAAVMATFAVVLGGAVLGRREIWPSAYPREAQPPVAAGR